MTRSTSGARRAIGLGATLIALGAAATAARADEEPEATIPNAPATAEVGAWAVYRFEGQLEVWVVEEVAEGAILVRIERVRRQRYRVLPRTPGERLPFGWLRVLMRDRFSSERPARLEAPTPPWELPPELRRDSDGPGVDPDFDVDVDETRAGEELTLEKEVPGGGKLRLRAVIDPALPGLGVRELVMEHYFRRQRSWSPSYSRVLEDHGSPGEEPPAPDYVDADEIGDANLSFDPFVELEPGARSVFEVEQSSRVAEGEARVAVEVTADRGLRFRVLESEGSLAGWRSEWTVERPAPRARAIRPRFYLSALVQPGGGRELDARNLRRARNRRATERVGRERLPGERIEMKWRDPDGDEAEVEATFVPGAPVGFTELEMRSESRLGDSELTWTLED